MASENENGKRETVESIESIVAQMREHYVKTDFHDGDLVDATTAHHELLAYAAKLEAALKRERESLLTKHGENVNSGSVVYTGENKGGNAAAMREALEEARRFVFQSSKRADRDLLILDDQGPRILQPQDTLTKIDAALALPRRQCDVGTAEEQAERMRRQFCAKQKRDGIIDCSLCPIRHAYRRDCTLALAQMTYAAEE